MRYRVRTSDTLGVVADEFDVSVGGVEEVESPARGQVVAGTRLKIYPGGMTPPTETKSAQTKTSARCGSLPRGRALREYRMRKLSVTQRRRQTDCEPHGCSGTAAESGAAAESGQPVVHHVQPGETLYSIAKAYKTTVEALRSGNQFLLSRPLAGRRYSDDSRGSRQSHMSQPLSIR